MTNSIGDTGKQVVSVLENSDRLMEMGSRRTAVKRGGRSVLEAALAAVPFGLAALTEDAFAQESLPQEVVDVLNFALTLEYLEDEFYLSGLEASGLIPDAERPIFELVSEHETAHVALLQEALGDQAVEKPSFDFTAGGTFDPFGDYPTFQVLAQGFEDTGVRAYKGQAPNLIGSDEVLTTALRIHSVEARHAARIRRLRGKKETITLNETDVDALEAVYAGDEVTTQAGVSIPGAAGVSDEAASEAFDEFLTRDQVLEIAGQFIES